MLDWFDYHGHICIVFDKLGHSVYEFLVRATGLLLRVTQLALHKLTTHRCIKLFYK